VPDPVESRLYEYGRECPSCGELVDPGEFPYSHGVRCAACDQVLATDWEESGDGMEWWFTGEIE
jgi:hypothetical protein